MKQLLFISALVIILSSCSKNRNEPVIYFSAEKATAYFRSIDSICNMDNGKLWGVNLAGPLMFVDRPTRRILANMPDNEGLLKLRNGVYQGTYPRERIIENTAVEFGKRTYAMTPLPPREDEFRIKSAAINSLFHCFQKNSDIICERFIARSMDEKYARIWLKLELRALSKVLESDSSRLTHYLRDAIIFRGARRELFPLSVKEENQFEIYEGLSMFTSTLLCSASGEEAKHRFFENLNILYRFQSFSRSYGPIIGGIYSYLLYSNGFDLKTILKSDTADFGNIITKHFNLQLPEICRDVAGSLALIYDVESIYREEEQRMADIKERIRRQLSRFTEKPVLSIELESPYFDFEPEDIRSLDTLGTIYNSIRVSDNWGKLTVEKGGCLVSYNLKHIRLTARNIKESKNHCYGDGWHIILNNNWKIIKEDDNYALKRTLP
ncbi:MAG: hypothetical protein ACUVTX_05825 [Bacteroidales bacterium]